MYVSSFPGPPHYVYLHGFDPLALSAHTCTMYIAGEGLEARLKYMYMHNMLCVYIHVIVYMCHFSQCTKMCACFDFSASRANSDDVLG